MSVGTRKAGEVYMDGLRWRRLLSKAEREHLRNCSSYHDACGTVVSIMEKVKARFCK